ncbi:Na+/H+ antiporter subunit D [Timonella senegalensis]|uniref:Na+/H+ antiporter subunit D n=1 Tax=Timonella senegalensis TaxID=1465825 RepID=UPI0002FDA572|nr:Na+/H+ antiporter subunit D [Timonella senegalensis]
MTDFTWLVPLPVVIPLCAAGLTLAFYKKPGIQQVITILALVLMVAFSGIMMWAADQGPIVVNVGEWAAPVGINLVGDRLSALMLTVSSTVLLCVLVYSLGQGIADSSKSPVSIYHPTYLVLAAGVSNAFLAGDLFNLYVGFEILLAASYVLLTLGGTFERIRAGAIYVVVALLSSLIFLIALAMTYAATGTVNLAQLGQRLSEIDPNVSIVLQSLLLLAFGIKAAIFPLSSWLPDSYPTAPAPVTAVFAGLLTKVGVYAIIRTQTLLFPDGRLNDVLMWLALATMLVGIMGAVAQNDIKRLMSFTLVSHIGYMIFGIAVGSQIGLGATIFYVAHHITVQTTLFLIVGLIERRGGTTSLSKLGGLAKTAPFLAILFFIPAMNLAGIPPFSGFLGKVGLLEAGVAEGTWLAYTLVIGSVVASLLTLYAIVKAWNKAFWQPSPEPLPDNDLPRGMIVPAGVMVVLTLMITVVAGPLYNYTSRAATTLIDNSNYIDAVLGDAGRGTGESTPLDGPDPVDESSVLDDNDTGAVN